MVSEKNIENISKEELFKLVKELMETREIQEPNIELYHKLLVENRKVHEKPKLTKLVKELDQESKDRKVQSKPKQLSRGFNDYAKSFELDITNDESVISYLHHTRHSVSELLETELETMRG